MTDYVIDIVIGDGRWPELPHLQTMAECAVSAAMEHIDARDFVELSLAFLDDEQVQQLNSEYRGKDQPTNVLSFPGSMGGGFSPLLGDVIMAYETVVREADGRGIPLMDHITHLLVHGFLHLNGYDHENMHEAEEMEALEVMALAGLGISDPYANDEIL